MNEPYNKFVSSIYLLGYRATDAEEKRLHVACLLSVARMVRMNSLLEGRGQHTHRIQTASVVMLGRQRAD